MAVAVAAVVVTLSALACSSSSSSPLGDNPNPESVATRISESSPVAAVLTAVTGRGEPSAAAAGIETCLKNAGLTLASESPSIAGINAIGVSTPSGTIQPGDLSAAVFLFDTEIGATLGTSTLGRLYDEASRRGTRVVAYDPLPSAELRQAVERCVPA
jgi:hypothetical protein